MKHKHEIIRWANSPDGTKVWVKKEGYWEKTNIPNWNSSMYTFIVDDKQAEVRKAQINK